MEDKEQILREYIKKSIEPMIREELEYQLAHREGKIQLPKKQLIEQRLNSTLHDLEQAAISLKNRGQKALDVLFERLSISMSPEEVEAIREEVRGVAIWAARKQAAYLFEAEEVIQTDERLPLSEETVKKFYKVGCDLFEDHLFEKAGTVFFLLTICYPTISDYWLAYGSCFHQLEQYEDALTAYAAAIFTNPKDLKPRIFSAQIYLALDELEDAYLELKECEKLTAEDADEECQELLQIIREEMHG